MKEKLVISHLSEYRYSTFDFDIKAFLDYCNVRENKNISIKHLWSQELQSKYIESILLGLPRYPIIMYLYDSSTYEFIDGNNRFCALDNFYRNNIVLTGLEKIKSLNGIRISDLPENLASKLLNTEIKIHVFDAGYSSEELEDIYNCFYIKNICSTQMISLRTQNKLLLLFIKCYMKNFHLYTIIIGLCLISCNQKKSTYESKEEQGAFLEADTVEYDDIWGQSKIIDNKTFKYYEYKKGDKIGILDSNKQVLIPASYASISLFDYGFCVTEKDGNGNLINGITDIKGNTLINVKYNLIISTNADEDSYYLKTSINKGDNYIHGICLYDGTVITEPKYKEIEYLRSNCEHEAMFYGKITDKIGEPIFYRINSDNTATRFFTPQSKTFYQAFHYYSKKYNSCGSITAYHCACKRDNILYFDYEKYELIDDDLYCCTFTSFNGEECNKTLTFKNDNELTVETDNSIVYYRKINTPSYPKFSNTNSSTSPIINTTIITDNTSSPAYNNTIENNKPKRVICRSCKNTGLCGVCHGAKQIKTRLVRYGNCNELEWEPCHHCKGTGKCPACHGDGWLDEGIDY